MRSEQVIGLLRGAVVLRTGEGEVIVDVGGVGYRVAVTPATAAALVAAGAGAEATLYVHTHVREDAIVLYGFVHDDERRCFEVLLGSHGVGPALALAIMAALSPAALVDGGARGRPRHAVHGAGGGAQDGGPAADRAEEPARPARPLAWTGAASGRWRAAIPWWRATPDVAGRGAGGARASSATPPTRSAVRSTAYATMSGWKRCSAWRCASWPSR